MSPLSLTGGVCPDLEHRSSVYPDLELCSSALPGTEPGSLVLPNNEHRHLLAVPSNIETLKGLTPSNSITHIEVMTAVHTDKGSDRTSDNDDMSDPSPSLRQEGRNVTDDNRGWTTVHRKGRKSRSVLRDETRRTETVDTELSRVVREAEKRLTPNDRRRINNRILALRNKPTCRHSDGTSETVSKGEGPSTLEKGKGVDPRNWGVLSEGSEDLDLDGQRAALESWNLARDMAHSSAESSDGESPGTRLLTKHKRRRSDKGKDKVSKPNVELISKNKARTRLRELLEQPAKEKRQSKHERRKDAAEKRNLSPVKVMVDKAVTLSDKRQKCHRTLRAMEPVEQIDPNSYIGLAFKRLDKRKKKRRTRSSLPEASSDLSDDVPSNSSSSDEGSSDSSESSSDSSDSSTTSSDTNSLTTSSRSSRRGRRRRNNRSHHRGSSRC